MRSNRVRPSCTRFTHAADRPTSKSVGKSLFSFVLGRKNYRTANHPDETYRSRHLTLPPNNRKLGQQTRERNPRRDPGTSEPQSKRLTRSRRPRVKSSGTFRNPTLRPAHTKSQDRSSAALLGSSLSCHEYQETAALRNYHERMQRGIYRRDPR